MKALVTGGGGSIGSRLVAALDARGDQVAVLDVSVEPEVRSDAFDRAEIHVGEVQDPSFVDDVVAGYRPDSIFHLAAILSGRAEEEPDLAWRVNVDGTRNVLEAARRSGVQRVLFTSTIATFGSGVTAPATDDSGSALIFAACACRRWSRRTHRVAALPARSCVRCTSRRCGREGIGLMCIRPPSWP